MRKIFLLFSHKLTIEQEVELKEKFNINHFVYLPENLQKLWSKVPENLKSLMEYAKPFKDFILHNASSKEDVVLIQGEFGLSYILINFVLSEGFKAIYSTTKRIHKEERQGSRVVIKKIFTHSFFREYGR